MTPRWHALAVQQEWRCYYCDRTMVETRERANSATVDHKVPRCCGGSDRRSNVVAACWRCNHLKGALTDAEFWRRWPNAKALPEAQPRAAQWRRPTRNAASVVNAEAPWSNRHLPATPAEEVLPTGLTTLGEAVSGLAILAERLRRP